MVRLSRTDAYSIDKTKRMNKLSETDVSQIAEKTKSPNRQRE
jgi:hypothetical protein